MKKEREKKRKKSISTPPPPSTTSPPKQQQGARVLVAEACNHNRITQACNDIGLVQIPKALEK